MTNLKAFEIGTKVMLTDIDDARKIFIVPGLRKKDFSASYGKVLTVIKREQSHYDPRIKKQVNIYRVEGGELTNMETGKIKDIRDSLIPQTGLIQATPNKKLRRGTKVKFLSPITNTFFDGVVGDKDKGENFDIYTVLTPNKYGNTIAVHVYLNPDGFFEMTGDDIEFFDL